MSELLTQAKDRAGALFSGFTAGQKTITGLAIFGLIVGAVMFSSWASKPTYGPLFTNLSPTDAASITQKLTTDKVSYKLADAGTTVEVPLNDVYSERIKLAAAGLPSDGESGYSLLDKEGLTTSQFTQQVDYQRALEGELAKTISAINGVSAASVHLVIPQEDVFATSSDQASAAVLVEMTPGQTLNPTQVQAVVHLVASSVQGLDPNNVTVTDSQGDELAAPGTNSQEVAAGNSQQQQTESYQDAVATSLQQMLTQVLGPNHAVVRVTADLNYDQKATSTQTYPNPKPVPLNQSSTVENYKGVGNPPAGGTLSASPTVTTAGAATSTYSNTQTGTNFAVDTSTTQTITAPGAVNRLSIAVALDSNAKGINPTTVQSLVSAAAGIQPSRGDTVAVEMVPFDTSVAKQTQQDLKAAAAAQSQHKLLSDVKTGVLVLVVLIVVFFVLRSARRSPQRQQLAISPDLTLDHPATRALPANDRRTDSREALVPRNEGVAGSTATHQLNAAQPVEVAGLLRDWLSDRTA